MLYVFWTLVQSKKTKDPLNPQFFMSFESHKSIQQKHVSNVLHSNLEMMFVSCCLVFEPDPDLLTVPKVHNINIQKYTAHFVK